MKKKLTYQTKQRRGSLAVIPILLGFMVLMWAIWFFGFEQDMSQRISNVQSGKGIQTIIALSAAQKRRDLRQERTEDKSSRKYSDAEIDTMVNDFVQDLMQKNNIQ